MFVVASEGYVTGWDVPQRKAIWVAALSGDATRDRVRPPRAYASAARKLKISGGVVRVPLDSGATLKLRTADGKAVP